MALFRAKTESLHLVSGERVSHCMSVSASDNSDARIIIDRFFDQIMPDHRLILIDSVILINESVILDDVAIDPDR